MEDVLTAEIPDMRSGSQTISHDRAGPTIKIVKE